MSSNNDEYATAIKKNCVLEPVLFFPLVIIITIKCHCLYIHHHHHRYPRHIKIFTQFHFFLCSNHSIIIKIVIVIHHHHHSIPSNKADIMIYRHQFCIFFFWNKNEFTECRWYVEKNCVGDWGDGICGNFSNKAFFFVSVVC